MAHPQPDEHVAARRDEVVKRMLATPPQPKASPKQEKAKPNPSKD